MTMTPSRPKAFRTVSEFDFSAGRFRMYKVCARCDGRSQYSGSAKGPLCRDCIAVLAPAERARWSK